MAKTMPAEQKLKYMTETPLPRLILSLSIPGVPTQNSINILQDHGICVSAGSACAKGRRSHVMTAMNLPPEVIDSSFRVSLCRDTTGEELDRLVDVIQNQILPRAK